MAETTNQSSSSASVSTDEFASYRALSTWAVLCFVLSLLSVLSFAHWFFLWAFPVATLVAGALALRQIASAPQDWAGKRLAQTGVGLAILCFVGSLGTNIYWTNWVQKGGRAAADRFVGKLRAGELESAFWLTMPPGARKQAEKLELKDVPSELAQRYQVFREEFKTLAKGLADGTSTIEFDTVEQTGDQNGQDVAAVIYKVQTPEEAKHILVLATTARLSGTSDVGWHIGLYTNPYQPHSFQIRAPSGHGHSH
ncbi:MAG: hypothetical protein HY000_22220 [Planctomycetes bacterium]|nr:hypothetical protein [Planctomycetota bacterium]